jgi:hypothetical protein
LDQQKKIGYGGSLEVYKLFNGRDIVRFINVEKLEWVRHLICGSKKE